MQQWKTWVYSALGIFSILCFHGYCQADTTENLFLRLEAPAGCLL